MFLKQNGNSRRKASRACARAFAADCAVASRVVVAAGRRRTPLSRADARHLHEERPRLVVDRHRRADRQSRRRGRRVAVGSAAVPVRAVRVVVGRCRRRARRRGLSPRRAPRSFERSSVRARRRRLRAGAAGERGARIDPALSVACSVAAAARRRARRCHRPQPGKRCRLQRRDAAAARTVGRRHVAAVRRVVAARDGADRHRHRDAVRSAQGAGARKRWTVASAMRTRRSASLRSSTCAKTRRTASRSSSCRR